MNQLRANGVLILVGLLLAASQCKAGGIVSSLGKRNEIPAEPIDLNKMPELPLELEPLVSLAGHARLAGSSTNDLWAMFRSRRPEYFGETVPSFVRQEMGLLFAGRDLPSIEEFGKEFREKLIEPCKRLHPLLVDWWKAYEMPPVNETSILIDQLQLVFPKEEKDVLWLVTERLCLQFMGDFDMDKAIGFFYKRFERKYQHDLNQENKREKFAEEIDTILERATVPLNYFTLSKLGLRAKEKTSVRDKFSVLKKLELSLAEAFADAMRSELQEFVEKNGYKAVDDKMFEREFKSKIWMPCKTISNSLDSWYSLFSENRKPEENEKEWFFAVYACRTLFQLDEYYRHNRVKYYEHYIMHVKPYWELTYERS